MNVYKFDLESLTNEDLTKKDILQYISYLLFEVTIEEGCMICNNCAKEYKITNGIPNMVLNDDEV